MAAKFENRLEKRHRGGPGQSIITFFQDSTLAESLRQGLGNFRQFPGLAALDQPKIYSMGISDTAYGLGKKKGILFGIPAPAPFFFVAAKAVQVIGNTLGDFFGICCLAQRLGFKSTSQCQGFNQAPVVTTRQLLFTAAVLANSECW